MPLEISRKTLAAETEDTSTSAFGPKGRELSGNSSEGYKDKGAVAKAREDTWLRAPATRCRPQRSKASTKKRVDEPSVRE